MIPSAHRRYVHFRKPPVVEVVCGVIFQPVQGLSTARVGQLWSRFGQEYVRSEDVPPLAQPMEIAAPGLFRVNMSPEVDFPRVWFVTADGHQLIQFQNGRLHYNWRKLDSGDDYPEFPAIYDQFQKHYRTLASFLADQGLSSLVNLQFEITYINIIPENTEWHGLLEIGKVLPDVAWRNQERFLTRPEHIAWDAKFLMSDEAGVLEVKAISTRTRENGAPAIILEITARGPARPNMDDWFDIGHRSIVRGFADLTHETIQSNVWEKEEDPS